MVRAVCFPPVLLSRTDHVGLQNNLIVDEHYLLQADRVQECGLRSDRHDRRAEVLIRPDFEQVPQRCVSLSARDRAQDVVMNVESTRALMLICAGAGRGVPAPLRVDDLASHAADVRWPSRRSALRRPGSRGRSLNQGRSRPTLRPRIILTRRLSPPAVSAVPYPRLNSHAGPRSRFTAPKS